MWVGIGVLRVLPFLGGLSASFGRDSNYLGMDPSNRTTTGPVFSEGVNMPPS
jgi:hypothetical protein